MYENQKRSLKRAYTRFLNAYLKDRNYAKTVAFFSDSINGFGTSKDEWGYDRESCGTLFERDIRVAPNPIDYRIESVHITVPKRDIGLVSSTLSLDMMLRKQAIRLSGIRYTLVFTKERGRWLIVHKHMSFPSRVNDSDEPYPVKELEERNASLERLVQEKTRHLERALEEITKLATIDKLTSINNRYKIDDVLSAEVKKAQETDRTFSVIMLDIDDFKRVNDTFGHHQGDIVLKEIAMTLKEQMGEHDILGRWGGEEFLIISKEQTKNGAIGLAERCRKALEHTDFTGIEKLTGSFGIAEYRPGESQEMIVLRADQALYRAKEKGKNRIEY
ncbi:MAG: diguanylate cyclase [Acholeplasmataceae bacterium]